MAVQEPRTSIIGSETDSDIIRGRPNVYDIASNRIVVVVLITACNPDDIEAMTMKMHRMLSSHLD